MTEKYDSELLDAAIAAMMQAAKRVDEVRSKMPLTFRRNAAFQALDKGPRLFLECCAFIQLLKRVPAFLSAHTFVLIVRVPRNWVLDDLDTVTALCLGSTENRPSQFAAFTHPERNKKGKWESVPKDMLRASKIIIFANIGSDLHPVIEAMADAVMNLKPMQDAHLDGLARLMNAGKLSADQKEFLRQQEPALLDGIFRSGRRASLSIERLQRQRVQVASDKNVLPMQAFGETGRWGTQLKHDLSAWRQGKLSWADVDRGILLYGPPGVGKTTFASSLAVECNAHFVPCSLAKWQSRGHLGDLLKAMNADFNEAREMAPAILFIDEVDAVGDRRRFSGDNSQYCTEVVTALLEAIDGSISREGVIIVAATNLPDRLDPALTRAGRLERHVEIRAPSIDDRIAILEFYLPELSGDLSVLDVAEKLPGYTGADLEYLARQVRQFARIDNRQVEPTDLERALPKRPRLTEQEIWRVCVHEAGHAIIAKLLNVGEIVSVEVYAFDYIANDNRYSHGNTKVHQPTTMLKTATAFRAEIAVGLAGLAAEEIICGDRSTSAGGSIESDLASATEIAARMVATFGMGTVISFMPIHLVDSSDPSFLERRPDLRREIGTILRAEYRKAKDALNAHKPILLQLAHALKTEGKLAGPKLDELLRPLDKSPLGRSEEWEDADRQQAV